MASRISLYITTFRLKDSSYEIFETIGSIFFISLFWAFLMSANWITNPLIMRQTENQESGPQWLYSEKRNQYELLNFPMY